MTQIKLSSDFEIIQKKVLEDKTFRKHLAREDAYWFFGIYFSHYIQYPSADLHREIFQLIQDEDIPIVAITAFRSSGKSTLCSLVLPIWAVIGRLQKKHIVIVCQTQQRAKETLANIRQEFETNELLRNDFNATEGKTDKWSENTIIVVKYNTRITVISVGESIRGMRHQQYRPDLIICDDLEDVPSCASTDNRKKLWQFVNGELIPAGDKNTKYVFIGNKVHNDSAMMKLKNAIELKKIKGVYKEYPLIDQQTKTIAWTGKFENQQAIDKLKFTYASEIDYLREQMLIILPDGDAIIKPEDIHYYDNLPLTPPDFFFLSIDQAYSEKNTADKTAIIVASFYELDDTIKIYIHQYPINQRFKVTDMIESIKQTMVSLGTHEVIRIFAESGSAQKGIVDMLAFSCLPVEGINVGSQDKKARLSMASPWIKNSIFLFPKTGCEELIDQLLYFGTERYDDLVDALTLSVIALMEIVKNRKNKITIVPTDGSMQDKAYKKAMGKLSSSFSNKEDWGDKEDAEMFRTLSHPKRYRHW